VTVTQRSTRLRRGFSLIEALAALAMSAMLFAAVAQFTGVWFTRWRDIVMTTGRQDQVLVVLDRITDDIEAAVPVFGPNGAPQLLFDGRADRLTFARHALGFNQRGGVDAVTYAMGDAGGRRALIRSRRTANAQGAAGEDLPLLRSDVSVAFAYGARDGTELQAWSDPDRLPSFIRVTLSGTVPAPWNRSAVMHLRALWPEACAAERYRELCRNAYP
jgi:general secretion pathway protein J